MLAFAFRPSLFILATSTFGDSVLLCYTGCSNVLACQGRSYDGAVYFRILTGNDG